MKFIKFETSLGETIINLQKIDKIEFMFNLVNIKEGTVVFVRMNSQDDCWHFEIYKYSFDFFIQFLGDSTILFTFTMPVGEIADEI